MLKEQQNKLKEKLNRIIKEVGHMNSIKQDIGKEFISRNMFAHRAIILFTNPDYLYTLTDSEDDIRFLFLFSISLNNALKDKEIDIKLDIQEYFTQLEYNNWIGYKEESEPVEDYPIIFEDAQPVGERMWQTTMTSQRFEQLNRSNKLYYNFRNQRNPKVTVSGIGIDIDKTKPLKIKNRILEGKQFPDHIKFNILRNYEEEMYYDAKTRRLIINKGFINLSDGQHRKIANSLLIEESPDNNFVWGLVITNYTENETKDFILQINEQKPFRKEQKEEMDLNKKQNNIVDFIMDDRFSKFSKVIKLQESEVRFKKGLVTKNIIAEAIVDNYQLDDTIDIKELGKWIVEFMDYLFSLYTFEFIIDPYSIQDKSVINSKHIFYGYIALSEKLKNNSDWKQLTVNKMKSIDFSIGNELWREIGILFNKTNKINKSVKNKIYKLFREEV